MGLLDFLKKKDTQSSKLHEFLKDKIKKAIISWDKSDIYAVSLYVCDIQDNPCEPTVTLGYNTETHFRSQIDDASDEQEAKWNYAFWLQNCEYVFGEDKSTQKLVQRWIKEKGFYYYTENELFFSDNEIDPDTYEGITEAFVDELISIVKELHESGFVKTQFGKDIPLLIHELEYYDEIAEQNKKANPAETVADFESYCGE